MLLFNISVKVERPQTENAQHQSRSFYCLPGLNHGSKRGRMVNFNRNTKPKSSFILKVTGEGEGTAETAQIDCAGTTNKVASLILILRINVSGVVHKQVC